MGFGSRDNKILKNIFSLILIVPARKQEEKIISCKK
jgi:hypothetical protein